MDTAFFASQVEDEPSGTAAKVVHLMQEVQSCPLVHGCGYPRPWQIPISVTHRGKGLDIIPKTVDFSHQSTECASTKHVSFSMLLSSKIHTEYDHHQGALYVSASKLTGLPSADKVADM
jgi:hypothetical protein